MNEAVIYSRFSPRPGADTSESNEAQITLCRQYCSQEGLHVVGSFEDKAKSGSDENRPGLWSAIESLRRGQALVVTKMDRLSRDTYLSILIERAVEKRGARIVSTQGEGTEHDDPDAKMVRRILQAIAERERKVNAVRTSLAMKAHQARGLRMSSKPPYGHEFDPDDPKRLIEHTREQRSIGRVIQAHADGMSNRGIARLMDEERYPCRGSKWNHNQVKAILSRLRLGVE